MLFGLEASDCHLCFGSVNHHYIPNLLLLYGRANQSTLSSKPDNPVHLVTYCALIREVIFKDYLNLILNCMCRTC